MTECGMSRFPTPATPVHSTPYLQVVEACEPGSCTINGAYYLPVHAVPEAEFGHGPVTLLGDAAHSMWVLQCLHLGIGSCIGRFAARSKRKRLQLHLLLTYSFAPPAWPCPVTSPLLRQP